MDWWIGLQCFDFNLLAATKKAISVDWMGMAIQVLGGLGVFLYGMRVMSRGLESVGGEKMRTWLQSMTRNPFAAITTGVAVTCLVQSSSATTVMLVSLVHAGFLNLTQAVGVIMGANIGTTITGWLVAILGFKVKITKFALPAIAFGVFLIFIGKGRRRALWGEILVGFGLLFLGLMFMKGAVKPLKHSQEVVNMLHAYSASEGIFYIFMCIGMGTLVTILIQSSSATMTLTMALAAEGVIDFQTASALILGENIGTTITANLASIGTDVTARRAARAHFVFNMFGVLWAVILFTPFIAFIDYLVPGSTTSNVTGHMAAFHTVFNIINTAIFIPLIPLLAMVATRIVPGEVRDEEKRHIMYMDMGMMSTPSLAVGAVRQELHRMVVYSTTMLNKVMDLFDKPETSAQEAVKEIAHYEEIIDSLEREIAIYLVEVSRSEVSLETSWEISACMNMAHNLERIGDHGESLLRLLQRKYSNKLTFSDEAQQQIHDMADKVRSFLKLLEDNIRSTNDIMVEATKVEKDIDKARKEMRKGHIKRLSDGRCNVKAGLIFIDMLTSFEKIGDHSFNIAEFISHQKNMATDESGRLPKLKIDDNRKDDNDDEEAT